jgi:hypothetical protein
MASLAALDALLGQGAPVVVLKPAHALVATVVVASGLLNTYLGVKVGAARRKYKVEVRWFAELFSVAPAGSGSSCVSLGGLGP